MKLGLIGLGKMGGNMARRLLRGGHTVIGYNRSSEITRTLEKEDGLIPAFSLDEMVRLLESTRIIWTMLPAGQVTETILDELISKMSPGDILVDGANSNYKDTIRRAEKIEKTGVHYIDAGVSGGVWGLKEGYAIMLGGDKDIVQTINPIIETLAPASDKGWGWVGPHGAGHFVKMVHNGIEYGMMEAYAEGFELLQGKKEFDLDVHQISQIWQYGSVVRSWLLDLAESALADNPELDGIQGWVADSGEGRWTVQEALDQDVPAPVITMSLFRRFESRQNDSYSAKMLAALRNQFGGHEIKKVD
jgi:6-phosphogluconate dehydrogenase